MGSAQSCCATREKDKPQEERTIAPRPKIPIEDLHNYIHQKALETAVVSINGYEVQLTAPPIPSRQGTYSTNRSIGYSPSQSIREDNMHQNNPGFDSSGRTSEFQSLQMAQKMTFGNGKLQNQVTESELKEDDEEVKEAPPKMALIKSQLSLSQLNRLPTDQDRMDQKAKDMLNVHNRQEADSKFKSFPSLRQMRLNNSSRFSNKNDLPRIHLAYLFASPLVFKYVSKKDKKQEESGPIDHGLDEISYKDEFKNILNEINGSDRKIKYLYSLGTSEKLIEVFRKRTIGLHFSGHGLMNPPGSDYKKQFPEMVQGQYNEMLKDKGDILLFEDESGGGSQWFCSESHLKKVLAKEITKTKFVVVASCHSEQCGKIFLSADAEHVICINQEKVLNDGAACEFAKKFYNLLFNSRTHTIEDAFNEARDKILQKPEYGSNEADKYKFLVKKNHVCNKKDCIVFNMLEEGRPTNLQPEPRIMILPPNITPWTTRNVETHRIIEKLLDKRVRILEVFGQSGVGKSGIVAKATNYIADRNLYKGGIIFVNFSQIQSIRDALVSLAQKIDLGESMLRKTDLQFKQDRNQILVKIQQFTEKDAKVLFVFDNVDELVIKQKAAFIDLLNYFTENCENLQIIFTTSNHIDLKQIAITNLKPLEQKKARDLFIDRIPSEEAMKKLKDLKEIDKLITITKQNTEALMDIVKPQNSIKFTNEISALKMCGQTCKHKDKPTDCVKFFLEKHPMFKILTQPLYICLAASQLHTNSLSQIFSSLLQGKDQDEAGILAIDSTVQTLRKHCDIGIDILMLIGQTANGLSLENLQDLFPDKQPLEIAKIMEVIDQTSLLTKEPVDHENYNYKLQNFCSNYVTIKLENDKKSKIKYNRMLAIYYCNYLIKLKQVYESEEISFQNLIKTLDIVEKNIIYCIKYLVEQKWGELQCNNFDSTNIVEHFESTKQLLQLNRKISNVSSFNIQKKPSAFYSSGFKRDTTGRIGSKNLLREKTTHLENGKHDQQTNQVLNHQSTSVSKQLARLEQREEFKHQDTKVISCEFIHDDFQEDPYFEQRLEMQDKQEEYRRQNLRSEVIVGSDMEEDDDEDDTEAMEEVKEEAEEEENKAGEDNSSISDDKFKLPINLGKYSSNQSSSKNYQTDGTGELNSNNGESTDLNKEQSDVSPAAGNPFNIISKLGVVLKQKLSIRDKVKEEEIKKYNDTIEKFQNIFKMKMEIAQTQELLQPTVHVEKFTTQQSKSFIKRKTTRRILNSPGREGKIQITDEELLEQADASRLAIPHQPSISIGTFTQPNQKVELLAPITGKRSVQQTPPKQQSIIEVEEVDDDIDSEAVLLLYHYLSLLALRNDGNNSFEDIQQLFSVLNRDVIFKANVLMLTIYQNIVNDNNKEALQDLLTLSEVYAEADSKLGMAIANYFFAYESWHHCKQRMKIDKIEKRLDIAFKLFTEVDDTEGVKYCEVLRKLIKNTTKLWGQCDGEAEIQNAQKSKQMRKRFKERKFSITSYSSMRIKLNKEKEDLNMLLNHVDFDKQVRISP